MAEFGPLAPRADGDISGGEINDRRRNKERRYAAAALLEQVLVLALDDLEPADAAADINADCAPQFSGVDLQSGAVKANSAAAMANWMKRPIFLISFFSMHCVRDRSSSLRRRSGS